MKSAHQQSHKQVSDTDELRKLLLGSEMDKLDDLASRFNDPKLRANAVSEVLPSSLQRAAADDPNGLKRSLQEPVAECLQEAIERNPRSFADIFYPVIGPAIRKSITDTLRGFMDNMNQTVEQSMSIKGLKWRFESIRTGIPFSEIALMHSVEYSVEQLFIVHRETGLLIEHVAHDDSQIQDSDAVSAMLTAIQDFVRDSFTHDQSEELDTVNIGNRTVWLISSPHSYLAAVIQGIPPKEVKEKLQQILEKAHSQHGDAFAHFSGDKSTTPGLEELLATGLLSAEPPAEKPTKPKNNIPKYFIGILLTLLLFYCCWQGWQSYKTSTAVEQSLANIKALPGIVLLSTTVQDDETWQVSILKDPLISQSALEHHVLPEASPHIEWAIYPSQSTEPELVLRRSRLILHPPEKVELALDEDTLIISGTAAQKWVTKLRDSLFHIPGVSVVDSSGLIIAEEIESAYAAQIPPEQPLSAPPVTPVAPPPPRRDPLEWATELLQPPTTVSLTYNDSAEQLTISGIAPIVWAKSIDDQLGPVTSIAKVNTDKLTSFERESFARLAAQIDGTSLYFADKDNLRETAINMLDGLALNISKLFQLATVLELQTTIDIIGYSDGAKAIESQQRERLMRANKIRTELTQRGVTEALLNPVEPKQGFRPIVKNPAWRKVLLQVRIKK